MTSATGSLRATLSNLGWLSFGRFFGDAATFVLLVVVSRWHGEEGLGLYAVAMAYAVFFAIAADLGLYTLFIREASHGQDPVQAVFGKVFSLGLGLTLLAFLALLATLMLAPLSPTTKVVVFVVGLQQLIYKLVEGCAAVFIVLHRTHVSSTLEVLAKSAAALAAAAMIVAGTSLPVALVALPCVTVVQLVAVYWLLAARIGWPPLTAHPGDLLPLLGRTVGYAASALQVPIYARADVITIGLLVGTAAVGIYSAAFRIVFLFVVVANLAALALFPLASRLYATSREGLRATYHAAVRVALLIALPAAFGLGLIAPPLIGLVFGPGFDASAAVLRVLCGLVVLFPLRSLLAIFMVASDRQPERARIEWLGVAVIWCGCLILVPSAGAQGAALAMLLAEAVMVTAMAIRLSELLGWPRVASRVAMSLLGIAAFYAPALAWPWLPLPVIVVMGVVVYSGILALSAEIRGTEYRLLRAALTGRRGDRRHPVG